ncbi:MAG: Asp23/Gls24 family envelope stress response protein [Lentisphaerales bacterium]|nr:Asp23/Gls24 family envelope stress response protein [Lentisphaerales bacterium]
MADKLRDDIPAIEGVYESSTEGGSIKIAENVFSSVIKNYTLEIEEVMKFASDSLVGSLAEMIGKKSASRSVIVDIDENDQVEVTVNIILRFGSHIPTVASQVQEVISSKVEEITGKEVAQVNVNVVDLVHEVEEDEEEDTAAE